MLLGIGLFQVSNNSLAVTGESLGNKGLFGELTTVASALPVLRQSCNFSMKLFYKFGLK